MQDLGSSAGYIEYDREKSKVSITTRPGGTIFIRSSAEQGNLLWSLFGRRYNAELQARHMEFYRALASSLPFPEGAEPIPSSTTSLPDAIASDVPLLSGFNEAVIAIVGSSNMYQLDSVEYVPFLRLLSCGKLACMVPLAKLVTCGFLPVETTQHAMVTTHRVMGLVSFKNSCKIDCLTPQFKLFYWAPVSRYSGIQLQGHVSKSQDCSTKCCPGPCCASTVAESYVAVQVESEYPVIVPSIDFDASKRGGLLEHPDLKHFQLSLAWMEANKGANLNTGPGSPYFFQPGAGPRFARPAAAVDAGAVSMPGGAAAPAQSTLNPVLAVAPQQEEKFV